MLLILKDGHSFDGSATEVLLAMKATAFNGGDSLDAYIAWMVDNARKFYDVTLEVRGETTEARALSLIDELVRTGLATVER